MLLKKVFVHVFICLEVLCYCEYVDSIQKLVKKFATLNEAGVDTFDRLNRIGTSTISALKLGVPMGSLIAAGLDDVFDPSSDEQNAIKLLHTELMQSFNKVNYQREKAENDIRSDLVEIQYNSEVTVSLMVLFNTFEKVTDPDSSRKFFKTVFLSHCTDTSHGPSRILYFLHSVFKENCKLPTAEDIHLYVRLQEAFTNIEARTTDLYSGQRFPWEYNITKNYIFSNIGSLNLTQFDKLLSQIETLDATTKSALTTSLNDLNIDELIPFNDTPCMLSIINNAHDYVRTPLISTIRQMMLDLVKTEVLIMACANVSSGGDKKEVDKIVNKTARFAEEICAFVSAWFFKTQELSWPNIPIAAVKNILGSQVIPPKDYNKTAKIVQEEFEKRGLENESYQVIVAITRSENDFWSKKVERDGIYCNILNFNGIDIHTIRYSQGESERAQSAAIWYESKRGKIWDILKTGMSSAYTSGVLAVIDQQAGPIVQSNAYRFALLMRNENFFSSRAEIKFGVASGTNSTNIVFFFKNDVMAYAWNLYLFM